MTPCPARPEHHSRKENDMTTVAIVLVVLVAAALAVTPLVRRRVTTRRLRSRFGPEYDRAVRGHRGDTAAAERELGERVALHRGLDLKRLPQPDRAEAEDELRRLQVLFVDDPLRAAADTERLLQSVLDRTGYPQQGRIQALSVDHADLLTDYRSARTTLEQARTATAGTEELRTALLAVRTLTRAVLDGDPGRTARDARSTGPAAPRAAASRPADGAVRTPVARHG
jgi:hypothetical protein